MQTLRLSTAANLLLLGVTLAATMTWAGQDSAPDSPPVKVGVRVVDRSGKGVTGLQAADFQLMVDGRSTPVASAEASTAAPSSPASGAGGSALAMRRLVVAVNRGSIAAGMGRAQLEAATEFLERLPPTSIAAVWALPAERQQLVFTSDRAVTRDALLALSGTKPQPAGRLTLAPAEAVRIARGDTLAIETASDRECPQTSGSRDDVARCRDELRRDAATQSERLLLEAQQTVRELRPLVRALERTRGLRHLVILTGGVVGAAEIEQEARATVADGAGRVTVHVIQVPQLAGVSGGRTSASDPSPELTLARETGGLVVVGNDVRDGFQRLERELAAEYVLAFTPEAGQRDGRLHEIAVRVSGPVAITVRAPRVVRLDAPSLTAPPAPPSAATAVAPPVVAMPAPGAAPAPDAGVAAPPTAPAAPVTELKPVSPTTETAGALVGLPVDALLERAGEYVSRFERGMSAIVLEERYVQIVKVWTFPPKGPDAQRLAWRDDESAPTRDLQMSERRQTKADVLRVQLPNQDWTAFRDTLEVNGRVLPGHENRLRKLFLEGTEDAYRQLRQIREASADWNLGGLYRDINVPTFGLMAVHPSYRKRFAFRSGQLAGQCRAISFTEQARPTLTRSKRGQNIPLVGNVCVDGAGAVWSTRIDFDGRYSARGMVRVTYRPEPRAEVLVPETMWEWYLLPTENQQGLPLYVEAMATYSNLRQFTVTTNEAVQ